MPSKTKTDAAWRAVHRAADAHAARFVGPFVASVEALRRRMTLAKLEESVVKGEMTWELARAIDNVRIAKIAADPADLATKVYAETIVAAVTGQAAYVESVFGTGGAQIVGRFNVVSPFVLRAARELGATMIREVGFETKMAVRRIIFNAVRDGVPPRDAARQIRDIIGLTTRQALAVNRLEAGLLGQGADAVFARKQGQRYSARLLRDRAENIARTETMLAANRGQQLLWSEMADAGVIPQDFGQRWLVTPDDRLCPRCAPMNGKVVQLGYLFRETENGVLPSRRKPVAGATVLSPPLHPRCRCTLIFDDDLAADPVAVPPASGRTPAARAADAYGGSLHALEDILQVEGPIDHPDIARSLRELSLIPEHLHRQLADRGVRVVVGRKAVPDLDEMGHLRGVRPRGYTGGTWDTVAGAYDPKSKQLLIGGGEHGSAGMAIHEYGHAVDYTAGMVSHGDDWVKAWHGAYHDLKSDYFRQDASWAGSEELFAESFAIAVRGGDQWDRLLWPSRRDEQVTAIMRTIQPLLDAPAP